MDEDLEKGCIIRIEEAPPLPFSPGQPKRRWIKIVCWTVGKFIATTFGKEIPQDAQAEACEALRAGLDLASHHDSAEYHDALQHD